MTPRAQMQLSCLWRLVRAIRATAMEAASTHHAEVGYPDDWMNAFFDFDAAASDGRPWMEKVWSNSRGIEQSTEPSSAVEEKKISADKDSEHENQRREWHDYERSIKIECNISVCLPTMDTGSLPP